jgi:hypothetical protein
MVHSATKLLFYHIHATESQHDGSDLSMLSPFTAVAQCTTYPFMYLTPPSVRWNLMEQINILTKTRHSSEHVALTSNKTENSESSCLPFFWRPFTLDVIRCPISPKRVLSLNIFPWRQIIWCLLSSKDSASCTNTRLIFYSSERTLAINPGSLGPVDWVSKTNNIWRQHNDWLSTTCAVRHLRNVRCFSVIEALRLRANSTKVIRTNGTWARKSYVFHRKRSAYFFFWASLLFIGVRSTL